MRSAGCVFLPRWVLEGGALRMRHAVELAGLVIDATEVTGEGMTGRGLPFPDA